MTWPDVCSLRDVSMRHFFFFSAFLEQHNFSYFLQKQICRLGEWFSVFGITPLLETQFQLSGIQDSSHRRKKIPKKNGTTMKRPICWCATDFFHRLATEMVKIWWFTWNLTFAWASFHIDRGQVWSLHSWRGCRAVQHTVWDLKSP